MSKVDDALKALESLHPKSMDLGLERMERFLDDLGNPQDKFPAVIHVAGTNGKGSTIAIMRSIAEAAGLKVHVFTSPHLVRFNERIRLAGELISDDDLLELIDECLKINNGLPITYFEFTNALAFLAFSRVEADLVLVETGLGGRLDSTNVLEEPDATVITTISMDHTEWLGDTINSIIGEKAGIMKPEVPAVIGYQLPEFQEAVEHIVMRRAGKIEASLDLFGRDWLVELIDEERFAYHSIEDETFILPRPNLLGDHQIWNAGLAITALDRVFLDVFDEEIIARGLQNIEHQGRLQPITSGTLFDSLPEGSQLWFDGGHNDSAAQVLAMQLKKWKEQDDRPINLIFGMMRRKDPVSFVKQLTPYLDSITCIDIPNSNIAWSKEELEEKLSVFDTPTKCDNDKSHRYLLTGSLYLA